MGIRRSVCHDVLWLGIDVGTNEYADGHFQMLGNGHICAVGQMPQAWHVIHMLGNGACEFDEEEIEKRLWETVLQEK